MSNSSHHHRHGDLTKQKRARRILAFFLFLTVSLLSLTVCVRLSFVSKSAIADTLTSDTYVQGVYKNVSDYAHDMCDECSIPYDSVDSVITYDSVYQVQKAYFYGLLSVTEEFTDSAYKDYIANIGSDLETSTLSMLREQNIPVEGRAKEKVNLFAEKITQYITEVSELSFTNYIDAIVSFGSIASIVAMIGLFLLATVLVLFIVSIGKKLYRALRDIAISFYAAALLNIVLIFGVQAVKHFKTLLLYPRYLSDAIMEYVNNCIASVAVSSAVLFVIALAITTVVWTMKRNENS